MDVGAPEVGLIATDFTRWRGLVWRKAIRGGDYSSGFLARLLRRQVVHNLAVNQLDEF